MNGKLKSVLTAKKKAELLAALKKSTVEIINVISSTQGKAPVDKIELIETVLILAEVIDIEKERVRYELLVSEDS